MANRFVVFILGGSLLFLAAAPVARASSQEPAQLEVTASISSLSGDTRYELSAQSPDPRDPDQLVPIRSELIFPLDTTLLALGLNWAPGEAATGRWSVGLEFRTSLDDPSDKMTDGDWIDDIQIGHTESPATLELWGGALEVTYAVQPGPRPRWALLFRADYQRIEQHIVGYEGWRRSLFSEQVFPVSGTAPVLDYEVTHFAPQLGARGRWDLATNLEVALQGTAGVALASDRDDHLLRGRVSEGDGVGFAGQARLAVDLLPGFVGWKWLTAGLFGEIRFRHAEGDVTQTWYRNEDQPEGTVIADIPYTIESLQYEFGLGVGAAF